MAENQEEGRQGPENVCPIGPIDALVGTCGGSVSPPDALIGISDQGKCRRKPGCPRDGPTGPQQTD